MTDNDLDIDRIEQNLVRGTQCRCGALMNEHWDPIMEGHGPILNTDEQETMACIEEVRRLREMHRAWKSLDENQRKYQVNMIRAMSKIPTMSLPKDDKARRDAWETLAAMLDQLTV